jgi:glycosyltransferase 2 family protein
VTLDGAEPAATSPKPLRRAVVLGLVVGVPVSIVFFWLAFRNANVDAVWAAARDAELALVALAVLAIALLYVFQAARWRRIAASEHPGLGGFFEFVIGAVACNNVLPGRIGELFRARWLAVAAPMPSGRALGTIGLDRGADIVALFTFLVVSLPFVASAEWVNEIVLGGVLLLVLLAAVLAGARLYAHLRHRDRHERGRLRRIVRDTVDTLAEPLGRRRIVVVLALSLLTWGSFALAVWLVARSIGVELGPLDCVFVTAVINLGAAIPSSPGFVGTYQWLSVAALGAFGVTREDALAFSFLLQASWYVPTTIIGGFLVLFRIDWGLRVRG